MNDLAEVCPLSRRVMSPLGSTLIRSITERRSLFPHSSTRTAMGSPYGSPSPKGTIRAYPVPLKQHEWVRPCLSAGGYHVRVTPVLQRVSQPHAFWPKPVSTFGLSYMTTFISSSHTLVIPLNLAPHPHWYSQMPSPPHGFDVARRPGYIVPAASHRTVASPACAGRLLLTEQQVLLIEFSI
jgi:hypothetical protein